MALDEIYPQADASRYRVQTEADGPAGRLPLTGDDLRTQPSGNLFGKTMNAGMGWNPETLNNDEFMIISTQGGLRRRRPGRGARTAHRPLRAGPARARRGRRDRRPWRTALRHLRLRPVRRPHPGHRRHVRLPALPQRRRDRHAPAHPIAAHPLRHPRHRLLRQGTAGHDDGARLDARRADRAHPRRGHPARPRRRRPRHRADDRRALRQRRAVAGGRRDPGLQGLRLLRRRLPVSRHGRHLAGRRRGPRPGDHPLGARALRPAAVARPRARLRPGAVGPARSRPDDRRHHHRRRHRERDGRARRVRRLDEPAAAPHRHRPRCGAPHADRRRLGPGQRRGAASSASPRSARCTTRPRSSSSPAACPRRCCGCATSASCTRTR